MNTDAGVFVSVVNPDLYYLFRRVTAKAEWYAARHRQRWERRYGRKYPDPIAELGEFRGVNFVD